MRYFSTYKMMLVLIVTSAVWANAMTATTDEGRKVILNSDGTWKYVSQEGSSSAGTVLSKTKNATSVVKGKAGFYELWYNPDKWTLNPNSRHPVAEFQLVNSSKEGQAMVIAERISVPIETLRKIAIENGKKVSQDLEVTEEQNVVVNGQNFLKMRMLGTIQGIPFAYYGIYWTGKAGCIQLITYTAQNLLEEFQPDFDELLSGLVITRP
jgi:hypothetical protein